MILLQKKLSFGCFKSNFEEQGFLDDTDLIEKKKPICRFKWKFLWKAYIVMALVIICAISFMFRFLEA
jgi:hypothetical protein